MCMCLFKLDALTIIISPVSFSIYHPCVFEHITISPVSNSISKQSSLMPLSIKLKGIYSILFFLILKDFTKSPESSKSLIFIKTSLPHLRTETGVFSSKHSSNIIILLPTNSSKLLGLYFSANRLLIFNSIIHLIFVMLLIDNLYLFYHLHV